MRSLIFSAIFLGLFTSMNLQAALPKSEAEDLIKKGEAGAQKCNALIDDIKKLDKKFDESITYPNKKVALQVLKKLEKYPGTPAATQELMDRLVSTPERNLDFKWLATAMDKTLVCDPMAHNHIMTKLLRSARAFKFTDAEKKKMAAVLLVQMKKDTESPTHLGLMAPYLLVIDSLVDLGAIKMTSKAASRREALKTAMNQGLETLRERDEELKTKVNNREFQTKNFIQEVKANETTRNKFLSFVEVLM
ncbi:MAG: hypothetical protein AB7F59_07915 [Bdellovibrionales bacterium]